MRYNRPKVGGLDDIHEHIFDSIVDQRLPPGTKLNELTLCEIFNVGRRQIGQVLLRLAYDELITIHPNRGAFVALPDVAEARAIFEARQGHRGRDHADRRRRSRASSLRRYSRNVEQEAERARAADACAKRSGSPASFTPCSASAPAIRFSYAMVRQLVARTSLVVSALREPEHDEVLARRPCGLSQASGGEARQPGGER